jgi:hypothetical protein
MKLLYSYLKSGILLLLIMTQTDFFAQNVAINSTGNNPDNAAILDIESSNKGLLIPRVNLANSSDAITIPSPTNSLLVYNTNASLKGGVGYFYNAGTPVAPNWLKLVVVDSTGIVKSSTSTGDVVKLERFPMGEVSMNGNTTVTNISGANVWAKVAGTSLFSSGSYQFANGATNNRLVYTGTSMKMFHIACTMSVKSTSSGSNLKAVIYKNGVPLTAGIIQTKMGSSSDIISTAIHIMTDMENGDYLELWITNTVGSNDFIVTEMNLFAMGVSMGMD